MAIRWILASLAGMIVGYCVLAMVFVVTAPDLRMRFLLVNVPENKTGIVIEQTTGLMVRGGKPTPVAHDVLLSIKGHPINTSLDFMREESALRSGDYDLGVERWSLNGFESPGHVPIEFLQKSTGQIQKTDVKVQSVPIREVSLTLVWFLLELLIFSVSAVAFWNRPFDDAARLFFAMCTVTLAAFVGGFHWWTLGSNFWLNLPFVICGVLLPAVILHFFLVYPRPKPPLTLWPRSVIAAIYAIPVMTIVAFFIVDGFLWLLMESSGNNADVKLALLTWLRAGIYSYICLAALYFVVALVALTHSWLTTRNPIERNQVRWILRAGCAASVFIGYSMYLAFFDRENFVLGGGRWPMFLASLVFMVAYAVGIVRYKLMLVDQIVNRGMSYYVLSYGATGTVAFLIASGTLAVRKPHALEQQTWVIAGIMMLAVILLIWLRDSWQMFVDRRFFREKYRLDKTLQRMNQAVGRLADVDFLTERMLSSCQDVLQPELAAIYLRDARSTNFRLAGATGDSAGMPLQFTAPDEFCEALQSDPTLQRVTSGSRDSLTPIQSLLRQVKGDLIHALETNGEITGVVVLGGKQSGLMYSAEDLTFLTALGQITGIALHSANVHQNLKHLNEELRSKVDQISQQRQQIAMLQAELTTNRVDTPSIPVVEFRREAIIGRGSAISRVLDMVRKVAPSESSVLVRGESGTGKELLAKAIHENSPRRNGPLVSVHCAALSSGLLESELFGHVKGSFTGAHSDKQGRFELAHGGTLFLDEIGDISAETQVKLLRVLQQREFEPVGGSHTIQVDVRLIAATHQNLERLIAEGKFREDLYYRLNVISVVLPPLRERPEDILDLSVSFLKSASTRDGKRIARFDDEALNALMRYSWPGNVRELQNVIERAVVLAESDTVELTDLPFDIQNATGSLQPSHRQEPFRRLNDLDAVPVTVWNDDDPDAERQLLLDALHQCGGNKTKAAKRLGLPRSTYFSKLKKHGITDDEPNDPPRFGRIPR
ncbi:sigma 54-interacting transcriptional regulator [Schlesneria paludicola]|uniref:sigma 54-interacting transcriptional regulator n=1 Tax=Schlesneria paludicola TaxID=360056 RepID=UPI001ED9448B|nr:sigma 54-interacting transcriptional regulator [Schlesneria paludicola]